MLFHTLNTNGIFKRGHLAALSGLNVNTLATYLHFLNERTGRKTEERKATRFTGIETMAVVMMAKFQDEWNMRPERSFTAAYRMVEHFVDEMESSLAGRCIIGGRPTRTLRKWTPNTGFPSKTYSALFDPDGEDGVISVAGGEFLETVECRRTTGRLSALLICDAETNALVFAPVIDLYDVLTGVDLIDATVEEYRRDDAHHE